MQFHLQLLIRFASSVNAFQGPDDKDKASELDKLEAGGNGDAPYEEPVAPHNPFCYDDRSNGDGTPPTSNVKGGSGGFDDDSPRDSFRYGPREGYETNIHDVAMSGDEVSAVTEDFYGRGGYRGPTLMSVTASKKRQWVVMGAAVAVVAVIAGGVASRGKGGGDEAADADADRPPEVIEPTGEQAAVPLDGPSEGETIALGEANVTAQEYVEALYRPVIYDRGSGYEGRTYREAVRHCSSLGRELCPLEAVCPSGPWAPPLGGIEPGSTWSPVRDRDNEWVQLGEGEVGYGVCRAWSDINPDPPEWGVTGEGTEGGSAEAVYCCVVSTSHGANDGGAGQDATSGTSATSGGDNGDGGGSEQSDLEPDLDEEHGEEEHRPTWIDRSDGWDGTTYLQALMFCASAKEGLSGGVLCPLSAICPGGEGTAPRGGVREAGGNGQRWTPVGGDVPNAWVQVGPGDETCVPRDGVLGGPPGEDDEDATAHIMCCVPKKGATPSDETASEEDLVMNATDEAAYEEQLQHAEDLAAGTTNTASMMIPPADEGEGEPPSLEADARVRETYRPVVHDASSGWEGGSHASAVAFCASREGMLCPYGAYCPEGPFLGLYGGFGRDDGPDGVGWAPVGDEADGDDRGRWVYTGPGDNACVFYNELEGGSDPWEDGQYKGRVMCCVEPGTVGTGSSAGEDLAPVADEPEDPVDAAVLAHFKPVKRDRSSAWEGSTYDESAAFCASLEREEGEGGGMELCPFVAICPRGPQSRPFGGFDAESGGNWAAVSSERNRWVQTGTENPCVFYRDENGAPPPWGLGEGEDHSDVTKHIVCCAERGSETGEAGETSEAQGAEGGADSPDAQMSGAPATETEAAGEVERPSETQGAEGEVDLSNAQMLEAPTTETEAATLVKNEYSPQWFGRGTGWTGTTYSDAVRFCASQDLGLCPAEAYCPDGTDEPPYGLGATAFSVSWGAVADDDNEWVKLDPQNSCVLYTFMHPEKPDWGTTGREEVTRLLLCCGVDASANLEPSAVEVINDEMGPHPDPEAPPEAAGESSMDPVVGSDPRWYDRSSGWDGSTYSDGIRFCAKKASRIPCPFAVYCPVGPVPHVTGGVRDIETYSPMIDAANGWVSVGPDNTCTTYSATHPAPPKWGVTGDGHEAITREILCCREEEFRLDQALPTDFDVAAERSDSEQAVMDAHHPIWYDIRHGYHGSTHQSAEDFCTNIAGKRLCPLVAYCPNSNQSGESATGRGPLFLDRSPFEGEQWAPFANTAPGEASDATMDWVLIGTIGGDPATTCGTYLSLANMATWKASGSPSTRKSH
ncbi:hypothetical protein ACHAWF_009999, partial [Thalassiosira exigua]